MTWRVRLAGHLRSIASRLDPPPKMTFEEAQAQQTAMLRAMVDHLGGEVGVRCPRCGTVSKIADIVAEPGSPIGASPGSSS